MPGSGNISMSEPADTADSQREVYFLDANILMYAIGREHPYKESCIRVLERIEDEAIRVVSSVEVLQEILHRYRSLREYEVAASAFTHFKMLCDEILPLGEVDVDRAFQILEAHREISVRDAIHAATMIHYGFERILSTDTHFDAIEGVVRVDPLAIRDHREPGPEDRDTPD